MIRRGFWLTAGAVTGIYGYRRVSAAGRRLSGRLTPGTARLPRGAAGAGAPASPRSRARRSTLSLAREALRFTRDVRDGMDLYMTRHSAPAGSTLMTDHDHDAQPEDGR
jgi:hypothetical protein